MGTRLHVGLWILGTINGMKPSTADHHLTCQGCGADFYERDHLRDDRPALCVECMAVPTKRCRVCGAPYGLEGRPGSWVVHGLFGWGCTTRRAVAPLVHVTRRTYMREGAIRHNPRRSRSQTASVSCTVLLAPASDPAPAPGFPVVVQFGGVADSASIAIARRGRPDFRELPASGRSPLGQGPHAPAPTHYVF